MAGVEKGDVRSATSGHGDNSSGGIVTFLRSGVFVMELMWWDERGGEHGEVGCSIESWRKRERMLAEMRRGRNHRD